MAENSDRLPYVLGLDLGVNSLGWAIVGLVDGVPAGFVDAGVRIFPEAVENMEKGRDEPRNAQRRSARQMRRQTYRRARRIAATFRVLQKAKLLPPFPDGADSDDPLVRHRLINELDAALPELAPGLIDEADPHRSRCVLHYRLRAMALHQDLPAFATGRALLHIAQRRGFKSGRLDEGGDAKKAKELGPVKTAIQALPAEFERVGASTIGEYWSKLDPNSKRIRGKENWSSRQMHLDEFERIWKRQAPCHPDLMTPEAYRMAKRRIFFQRPLKSSAGLIGRCELEPSRRRAPLAHPLYQQFRVLQTVNDLRIISPTGASKPLTPEQRSKALGVLADQQTVTFRSLAKKLGLGNGETFSHEAGERKDLPGNRTESKLRDVFGDRWAALSEYERSIIAGCVRSMDDKAALCRMAEERWGVDAIDAARLSDLHLEQGYGRLSLAAVRKLLPLMEQGIPYMTAVDQVYPNRGKSQVRESLPAVLDLKTIRNPAVVRSLTELRKVVNALIREYGHPEEIHVELARELKKTAETRKKIAKENDRRAEQRKKAIQKILDECGLGRPSNEDVEKAILWEECRHQCPYTGETINFCDLFGRDAKWEIEHIVPYSRSLDDSLANKTLCHREANRRKGNKTPFEAFGNTPEWEMMLERVGKFEGEKGAMRQKLARFATREGVEELFADFTERQLNDTKYASRAAAEYLGLLYGGICDENGNKRIRTVSGGVTAQVRKGWRLHSILRDGPSQNDDRKPRDDHRHHAIDALVVALTSESAVQALSRASEQSRLDHRRGFRVDDPWNGFLDEVRAVIGGIKVSHRPDHRLRGALHAESLYSPPRFEPGAQEARQRIRKPLSSLTAKQIEDIVDVRVREAVAGKLTALGQPDPNKAFQEDANLPTLENRHGAPVPIRRARIYVSELAREIGKGAGRRYVASKENHHLAIYRQAPDRKGVAKWRGQVVSLLEATLRKEKKQPVIAPADDVGGSLVMALYKGDIVEMSVPKADPGERDLFVIRGFSIEKNGHPEIVAVRHNLAAQVKDLKARGDWIRIRKWEEFRRVNPKVVQLDFLGRRVEDACQPNS
jgi:CRISPR-associated endonuclease Csn1